MPDEFERWGKTWAHHHPRWEMKLWTEANLPPSRFPDLLKKCPNLSWQSNIVRHEVMYAHGGIYVDTDFECLRSIEPLIQDAKLFAAFQTGNMGERGAIACGLYGSSQGHSMVKELLDGLSERDTSKFSSYGPFYFTDVARRYADEFRVLERRLFYPYSWDQLGMKNSEFAEAYAVHHWSSKWYEPSQAQLPGAPDAPKWTPP